MKRVIRILPLLLLILLTAGKAKAAVTFKTSSVLSTGKWVKIKVEESGVYEISYDQLRQYGFSDPEKVKVFGTGGNIATENFTAAATDDLEQTPTLRENGKIYFYAKGSTKETFYVYNPSSFFVYSQLAPNPYSSDGFYFLTDSEDQTPLLVESVAPAEEEIASAEEWADSGTAVWLHEQETLNIGRSGRNFYGEDFSATGKISLDVPVPGLTSGQFQIYAVTAIRTAADIAETISINGTDTKAITSNTLKANTKDESVLFSPLTVYSMTPTDGMVGEDQVELTIDCHSTDLHIGRMDYVTISYPAVNGIPSDSAQARLYYKLTDGKAAIRMANATPTTRAWIVDDAAAPAGVAYPVREFRATTDNEGNARFIAKGDGSWGEIIYFDTALPQKQTPFVETVDNQNIHASESPDMLIITTAALTEQAERIADYHRKNDGMDVLILDHRKIFNEFSSGVPDAMAYRRIAKMFYQRDPMKFRYLLLFGGGNYDNRGLNMTQSTDLLLTWQSADSYNEVNSYCTDDFFGIFAEGTGSLESMRLNIPVGRIPFSSPSMMKTYVDKLIAYLEKPDDKSSSWKSNMLLIGDEGDDYIHARQCESFESAFQAEGNRVANISKIYLEAYQQYSDSRSKLVDGLNSGQHFILFVGHSAINSMTKSATLMDLQKASETKYEAPPVMYVSSCDIGRYDIGQSTILDELMLNEDGGIIASIAATRQAYTVYNGYLTDSFAQYLAKDESYYNGEKTLGRLLMSAKNDTKDRTKNRLKYHLFGDPAMPMDFPENRITVTEINGNPASETSDVGVLGKISVTGEITADDGTTDTGFNGYIKLTLLDSERDYMKYKIGSVTTQTKERGTELAYAGTTVTAGKFSAELTMPPFATADKLVKPIHMTAISEDGATVVAGRCEAVALDTSISQTDGDTTPPAITEMYVDTPGFSDGDTVGTSLKIYATVVDNAGVNFSKESISASAYIAIDGGKESYPVSTFTYGDQGEVSLSVPIFGITPGHHTARLLAADLAGNTASRTISFLAEEKSEPVVVEVEEKAVTTAATISVVSPAEIDGEVELRITDRKGDTVFRTQADTLPYTWNVCDNRGDKVPAGVYDCCAIVGGIGSAPKKIVIVEQ